MTPEQANRAIDEIVAAGPNATPEQIAGYVAALRAHIARHSPAATCAACGAARASWPLPCAGLAPDGRRFERGACVCVACCCTLTDAPEAPSAGGPR